MWTRGLPVEPGSPRLGVLISPGLTHGWVIPQSPARPPVGAQLPLGVRRGAAAVRAIAIVPGTAAGGRGRTPPCCGCRVGPCGLGEGRERQKQKKVCTALHADECRHHDGDVRGAIDASCSGAGRGVTAAGQSYAYVGHPFLPREAGRVHRRSVAVWKRPKRQGPREERGAGGRGKRTEISARPRPSPVRPRCRCRSRPLDECLRRGRSAA